MRRVVLHRPNLSGAPERRPAFTLVEILVVILIILIVSVLALGVYRGTGGRQVGEAARLVQAELAGARDAALRTGRPAGVRLLPDPSLVSRLADGTIDPAAILAADRMVPLAAAPNYSDGHILSARLPSTAYPAAIRTVNGYAGVPCLVAEQAVLGPLGEPNPPTSWFWNIRIGDQIQLGTAGPWYTVVGPMQSPNPELFVNVGPPGATLPVLSQGVPAEFLLLVNGRDDNGNGWVDEGWDGVDNNHDGVIDDAVEWESEVWR